MGKQSDAYVSVVTKAIDAVRVTVLTSGVFRIWQRGAMASARSASL